jgi:hypothetical protein
MLVKVTAIGAAAGALVAFAGVTLTEHAAGRSPGSAPRIHVSGQRNGPYELLPKFLLPGPRMVILRPAR